MKCLECFQEEQINDANSERKIQKSTLVYKQKNVRQKHNKNQRKKITPQKISLKKQKVQQNQMALTHFHIQRLQNDKIKQQTMCKILNSKQRIQYNCPTKQQIIFNRSINSSIPFLHFHIFANCKKSRIKNQFNQFSSTKQNNYMDQSQKTVYTSTKNSLNINTRPNSFNNVIHQLAKQNSYPLIKQSFQYQQLNSLKKPQNQLEVEFRQDLRKIISQIYQEQLQSNESNDQVKSKQITSILKESSHPIHKQVYLKPDQKNGIELINSRISYTLSSVRNIYDILCTKTESIGGNSSQSQCSEIIESYLSKNKTRKNSSMIVGNQKHSQGAIEQKIIFEKKIQTKKSLSYI